MIVFPAISQTNLKVGNDTVVYYSQEENRKLSLMLIEADKNKALLENCENINNIKDSIIILNKYRVVELDSFVYKQQVILTTVNADLTAIMKENDKLKQKVEKRTNWLWGSAFLNIVFLIVLL